MNSTLSLERISSLMADARLAKLVAYIKGEQLEGAMHVAAIYGPLRPGGSPSRWSAGRPGTPRAAT